MKRPHLWLAAVSAAVVAAGTAAAVPAFADTQTLDMGTAEEVAPGVEYSTFNADTSHGSAQGHLLTVDLAADGVSVGALHPGSVAQTGVTTSLADRVDAVAGINADFFNIGETGAAVGPMVVDGEDYKAGVPDKQRHGPSLPPGTTNDHVFATTTDGTPAITELTVDGKVTGPDGSFELQGINQYAITVDGIGVFDSKWGEASRERATCGTDDDREGPCSDSTAEVIVTDGEVTEVSGGPGSGQLDDNQVALVARDSGVSELETLSEGDEVTVDYQLADSDGAEIDTAVGGMPIIMDGEHLELDDAADTLAPRTSVGASEDGSTLYMAAVDGRSSSSVGATLKSLADIMADLGSADAVNFDGGGSTTLVAREDGNEATSVKNTPSDGDQRALPNGLGVFSEAA